MKNYDSFLNEYYKGKNNSIGFKYKDAEKTFDVEFFVAFFEEISEEKFEELIDKYFKSVFDEYTKMVDIVSSSEKEQIIKMIKNKTNFDYKEVYEVSVKFDAYVDIEAYSMLNNMDVSFDGFTAIVIPKTLNGKKIDSLKFAPKSTKQIGFKSEGGAW